jgi:hypothetical protein
LKLVPQTPLRVVEVKLVENWFSVGHGLEWPIAFLIAILLFRQPLENLIDRIKRIEAFGSALDAQNETLAAAAVAGLATSEAPAEQRKELGSDAATNALDAPALVRPTAHLPDLNDPQTVISAERAWARIYAQMYRSQYTMLVLLYARGKLSKSEIKPFFDDGVSRGLTVNYDSWISFLVVSLLVVRVVDDSSEWVTTGPFLAQFITYCSSQNFNVQQLPY